MRNKGKQIILRVADLIETFMAFFLAVVIIVLVGKMVIDMFTPGVLEGQDMRELLEYCFGLIIGVEFIRMLLKHSAGSIIDIVLFSVARGMVVEHQNAFESVFIVGALMLVFVIRKYLLLPNDTEELEESLRK